MSAAAFNLTYSKKGYSAEQHDACFGCKPHSIHPTGMHFPNSHTSVYKVHQSLTAGEPPGALEPTPNLVYGV